MNTMGKGRLVPVFLSYVLKGKASVAIALARL
jgi:hypothetical protein